MSSQKKVISSFKDVQKVDYGAKFYKADFHFHTPASEDARGSNRYNFNPFKKRYPVPVVICYIKPDTK